jgi:tRNA dimethylallyltransferase
MPVASGQTFYLVGPTAVGKSELAVELAERLDAEIVGCDAYQVYKGLPILTAQPEQELQTRVVHHLIGEVPEAESFDVARYLKLARARIAEIHERGRNALVVGGTGMYLRALTRGLANLPPADPMLREELEGLSLTELLTRLEQLDPASYISIDRHNARRVVRAVEVCMLTGRRFSEFRSEWNHSPAGARGVCLERPRPELNSRIEHRVRQMFDSGVEGEIAALGPVGSTAAQTLGLREIKQVLAGTISVESAIKQIQQSTRQYAKRQLTWFRRESWMASIDFSAMSSREQVERTLQALLRS